MSTHGLMSMTGAAQTDAARRDWMFLADYATARNVPVDDLRPCAHDGWRRIDKCIARLRARLLIHYPHDNVPVLPSAQVRP